MKTHGGTGTPEFRAWDSMRRRCRNPADASYPRYGARDIKVCERWLKFENFLSDMGPRPSGEHSIDRIDNDGDYEPNNCRWATRLEQSNNRRSSRLLTVNGETHTLAEWERRSGLKVGMLFRRIKSGWPAEKAVVAQPRVYRRGIERVQSLQLTKGST